jgi:hypothetical protein
VILGELPRSSGLHISYIIFQIITSSYEFDIYLRMVQGSLTADSFKYRHRWGEFCVTARLWSQCLRKPSVLDDLAAQHPRTQPLVFHWTWRTRRTTMRDRRSCKRRSEAPMDRPRTLMDINCVVTVSLETVRLFREENTRGAGRMLVQISSILAIKGGPFTAFHRSS